MVLPRNKKSRLALYQKSTIIFSLTAKLFKDGILNLDEVAFYEATGYSKPDPNDNIVLTCQALKHAITAAAVIRQYEGYNPKIYGGSFPDWVAHNGTLEDYVPRYGFFSKCTGHVMYCNTVGSV